MVKIQEFKSKSSCKLSDIKGFIYGGFSSRFWMLRKHINYMDYQALDNLPLYCWKCITLQLEHRDLDLIIDDERHMMIFIKFLIFHLKTIDGKKGTGKPYLDFINNK